MIKKLTPIIGIVLFQVVSVQAQIDWFGYAEVETDYLKTPKKDYSFGYGKVRFEFDWSLLENIHIAGNINAEKYFGETKWDLLDFIPYDSVWTPNGILTTFPVTIRDTVYVDNLYSLIHFKSVGITLGRQPISLGTGYAWNPLDIFNQKDLMDPTYEQPGVNALRIEIPIDGRTTVDIIAAEHDSIKTGTKMLQLKTRMGSFDLTLNMAQHHHLFPYWRFVDILTTHHTSTFFGGSIVGQVGEIGIWSEIFGPTESTAQYYEFVIGADHTLDNGVYFMAEYFHNTLGGTDDELSIYHYMNAFSGESKSLMQDYLFAMSIFALNDFVSGTISAIGNLNDKSMILMPQLEWNVFENVNLSLIVSQSFGGKDTEFGIQERAARIRLRAYL